jgi:hypothetical protein
MLMDVVMILVVMVSSWRWWWWCCIDAGNYILALYTLGDAEIFKSITKFICRPSRYLSELFSNSIYISNIKFFSIIFHFSEDYIEAAVTLVNAVYSPYTPYLLDYSALQTGFLTENLNSLQMVWQSWFPKYIV